jgi:hypothetical protein
MRVMPVRALFLPWLPLVHSAAVAASLLASAAAWAQEAAPPRIYTCIDDKGRRLTSDRPIPECIAKEQRVLGHDGSTRGVRPPTLTPEEQAAKEARERAQAEERAARADAVRRDRNLLVRYRNEAQHNKARAAALDAVRAAIRTTEARLTELQAARKPLLGETEFYVGKALPPKLRLALEANETATAAQREAAQTQQAELVRITELFDQELARLRRLWAGAAPGSSPASASSPAPAKAGAASAPR